MSLKVLEGFEVDRHADELGRKYLEGSLAVSAQGNGRLGWGSYAGGGYNQKWTAYLGGAVATVVCGGAWYQVDGDAVAIFQLELDNAPQIGLYYSGSASRRLQVKRNGNTVLADITTYLVPTETWLYIEFKATVHQSAGSFEVRVNGATVATGNGLDTMEEGEPNGVFMDGQNRYDDVYICDTAGSQWNDFQGEIAIEGLLPDADGTHGDFTPQGAGANYVEVDDDGASDDDSTYNSSSTAGHKDSFDHPALANIGGTILGVAVSAFCRKDDAGSRNARALLRSNVTEATGDTEIASDTWTPLGLFAEVDPDTAAAWTEAGVNAAEFGYELVS